MRTASDVISYERGEERKGLLNEYFNLLRNSKVSNIEDAKKIWEEQGFAAQFKDWDNMKGLQEEVQNF